MEGGAGVGGFYCVFMCVNRIIPTNSKPQVVKRKNIYTIKRNIKATHSFLVTLTKEMVVEIFQNVVIRYEITEV